MEKTEFSSLRAEIRNIVDQADEFLVQPVIFSAVTRRCSKQVFAVTIAQMFDAGQLARRKAPKGSGLRFAYGPGPEPVSDKQYRADRPEKVKGFMAMKRERETRRRGAKGNRAAA